MNWFGHAPGTVDDASLEAIEPGTHLCSTCQSEAERTAIAVAFLVQGLKRGEQCVHVGAEDAQAVLTRHLVDRGFDVAHMKETGALVLAGPRDVGLKGDATDTYRMFTFWKKAARAAVPGSFRGLRCVSQMNWLSANVTTSQQLQAYEEQLAQLAQDTGCVLLCQYDPGEVPVAFMLDAICTHGFVIDQGELCRNVYYTPGIEIPSIETAATPAGRAWDLLLQVMRRYEESRRELVDAQAELERLARIITLGELTASIAHEVAQPVAAMIADGNAALRWLANVPPELEEARRSLLRIVAGGQRAESVIQRIRSLVKKADSSKELVSVNDVIMEVVRLMRSRLQQAGVLLRTDLPVSLPRTWAHRVQIQQVVFNLILNALEAIEARAHGAREIYIRAEHDARSVTVRVSDSGIGLGADQVHFVLKPFYTTKPHGMGIGLSISSRIIEGHHGRLWAERNPHGAGATFYFTLPLPPQQDSR